MFFLLSDFPIANRRLYGLLKKRRFVNVLFCCLSEKLVAVKETDSRLRHRCIRRRIEACASQSLPPLHDVVAEVEAAG